MVSANLSRKLVEEILSHRLQTIGMTIMAYNFIGEYTKINDFYNQARTDWWAHSKWKYFVDY